MDVEDDADDDDDDERDIVYSDSEKVHHRHPVTSDSVSAERGSDLKKYLDKSQYFEEKHNS